MKGDVVRGHKNRQMKENLAFLEKIGLEFDSFNKGYHIKVKTFAGIVDFWPSTNKFMVNGKVLHGDARQMLRYLNKYMEEGGKDGTGN